MSEAITPSLLAGSVQTPCIVHPWSFGEEMQTLTRKREKLQCIALSEFAIYITDCRFTITFPHTLSTTKRALTRRATQRRATKLAYLSRGRNETNDCLKRANHAGNVRWG